MARKRRGVFNKRKKIIFKKRVPEPQIMGNTEIKAFESLAKENHKRWIIPLIDDFNRRCIK